MNATNTEEFEEALAFSRYAGWRGGAQRPHRANGTDRARRPKADKEGQGAEGTSEAEGRLESQQDQRVLVPMGPTGPCAKGTNQPNPEMDKKGRFGNEDGHGIDQVLAIRSENGNVHINFFVRIQQ